MKGIVFTLFESFVVEQFGEEAWEAILDASPHEARGVRVGPGTYPDAHLLMLVKAACEKSGLAPEVAVRAFGKFLFFGLIKKYPVIAAQFPDAASMLKGIDSVIHVEVNKLLPGSVTPTILCSARDDGRLELTYASKRQMCTLLEGLLDGVAEHYGVDLERTHDVCMQRGAPRCSLVMSINPRRQAA